MSGEPIRRPDPSGGDYGKEKEIDYGKRDAEIADALARKYYLEHSGKLARTNAEFKAFMGEFKGAQYLGFDSSALIVTFEAYEERTPDPESRKEVLQMYAKPTIVLPGVGGGMLGQGEEKEGFVSRMYHKIRPAKGGGEG